MIDCARPTFHLNLTKQNKGFTRKFNPELYKNTNWLCGSIVTNKLCCWPCLLLSKKESIWSSAQRGHDDLNNLHTSIARHEKTASHLTAFLSFKTFEQSSRIDQLLDCQRRNAITKHNREVNKNKETLKRIIRMTCFLGIQEIPFRGHDKSETSDNGSNYLELTYFLAEFDKKLKNHLDTATVFRGFGPIYSE